MLSYQLLKRHLQERQNNQIWNIIQEHLYIDIFDGMPRSKSQIDAMSGSLAGEGKRDANKAKVGGGVCVCGGGGFSVSDAEAKICNGWFVLK